MVQNNDRQMASCGQMLNLLLVHRPDFGLQHGQRWGAGGYTLEIFGRGRVGLVNDLMASDEMPLIIG